MTPNKIPELKLKCIKHIMEYFFGKEYELRYFTGPAGLYVEIWEKKKSGRLGAFSVEHLVFIMIPTLLEKKHVMYSEDNISELITQLYDEFHHRYINFKTDTLCQKDSVEEITT